MASYFSLGDFRTASLDVGEHAHDERLDRTVLAVALSIVGAGMAFLLAMAFVFFPEWIRVNSFASNAGAPSPGAALHSPIVAAENVQDDEKPLHQFQSQAIARSRGRAGESAASGIGKEIQRVAPQVAATGPAGSPSPSIAPVGTEPAAGGIRPPAGRSGAANPGSPSAVHRSERARSDAAAENGRSPGRKA